MRLSTSIFFSLLLILSGCRVGPKYESPSPESPIEWKNPSPNPESLPEVCYWWEVFQDDLLDELEMLAVQNNPTVLVALARVQEAWALAGVRRADLFPQINLDPSYFNQGILFKIFLPNQINLPGFTFPEVFRIHQQQYTLPLDMSYQLDLWGKYRYYFEAAAFNAQSQEEDYATTILTLTSDLASAYYNLRTFDAVIEFYRSTVESRQKNLKLNKDRFEKGLVVRTDYANAQLLLSNSEADLEDALRQRGLLENMIATLIGVPASEFHLDPMPLKGEPPVIPAGIPSSVLLRRPDVGAAEREMASQHAMVGVAYASLLPDIELIGNIGFSSPTIRDFLSWKSRLWSIGVNTSQTIFDAGKKCFDIDVTWARFYQANGHYQEVVLQAFKEVEDALNSLEHEAKQEAFLKQSVEAARDAMNITTKRYYRGLITYTDVVVAQIQDLEAERAYINVQGLRFQSTIELIKALGGGWTEGCE